MKKGFTLIELLAVIVILAIIALIATPIVLNMIADAKEKSILRSAENYIAAVEQAVADKNLKVEYKPDTCKGSNSKELACLLNSVEYTNKLNISIENTIPDYVYVDFNVEKGKVSSATLKYDDQVVILSNKKYEIKDIIAPQNFETDTWETIVIAFRLGTYKNIYNLGETKEVDMGTLGIHTVRISNLSTSDECKIEGFSQTACGVVIEFEDAIINHTMNSEYINVGGWKDSEMRTYINNDILNSIKDETLKNTIINTKVISSQGLNDTSNFTSIDKLYLLSAKEVYGNSFESVVDTSYNYTRQLDYYSNNNVTISDNLDIVIKKYNGTSIFWWFRTAHKYIDGNFISADDDGSWNRTSYINYVAPAFRLAS